jgi:hypothetical protein
LKKILQLAGFCAVLLASAQGAMAAEDRALAITVYPTIIDGCYTQVEAEAEQAIRIHSELMVIGLNCQHMTPAGQKNLYQSYREFTSRHSDLFARYERTMLGYYARTKSTNPEAKLNTMRTEFANKIALDSARMRPDLFCGHYMPRIQRVSTMQKTDIQKWAATFFPGHPPSQPICGQK